MWRNYFAHFCVSGKGRELMLFHLVDAFPRQPPLIFWSVMKRVVRFHSLGILKFNFMIFINIYGNSFQSVSLRLECKTWKMTNLVLFLNWRFCEWLPFCIYTCQSKVALETRTKILRYAAQRALSVKIKFCKTELR